MKFNKKAKSEQLFLIIISMIALCIVTVCFSGCSGSCFGCSYACKGEDDSYHLGGLSYVSEGCCMSSSCKTASGELIFDEDENTTGSDEKAMQDVLYSSCTLSKEGCFGDGSHYIGCFVGKGVDCGNWSATCGSSDEDIEENTIKCVDGCISCDESAGRKGFLYELIYQLLGI